MPPRQKPVIVGISDATFADLMGKVPVTDHRPFVDEAPRAAYVLVSVTGQQLIFVKYADVQGEQAYQDEAYAQEGEESPG